uniref:Uncharacterized protein n=1 Tax=Panagrolaimus sp. ES5 TaxID=591445 RepID=A0AC34FBQ0_9BILA
MDFSLGGKTIPGDNDDTVVNVNIGAGDPVDVKGNNNGEIVNVGLFSDNSGVNVDKDNNGEISNTTVDDK